jgi:ribosomal-protein-alanine N-acetyltransferase
VKGKEGNLRETGLETERLLMRRWVSEQAQAWWTILGDPEVTRLTFGAPHPDLAYSQRVLEHTIRRSAREQPLGWWAVVERASDAIIGTIGLNATPEEGTAELGYHFRRTAWGKGYATEAVCVVVAYGFSLGGCQRIIACLHPANGASRRVLAKSGFRQLGAVAANGHHEEHWELAPHDVAMPG